jgi:hypothetical protein
MHMPLKATGPGRTDGCGTPKSAFGPAPQGAPVARCHPPIQAPVGPVAPLVSVRGDGPARCICLKKATGPGCTDAPPPPKSAFGPAPKERPWPVGAHDSLPPPPHPGACGAPGQCAREWASPWDPGYGATNAPNGLDRPADPKRT